MLALILAEDDSFSRSAAHRSRLQKFEVIRYRDPVKLVDNLPELKPDLVLVRERDFPLHGELIASALAFHPATSGTRVIVFSSAPVSKIPVLGNLRFEDESLLEAEASQGNLDLAATESPQAGDSPGPSLLATASERSKRRRQSNRPSETPRGEP